MRSMRNKSRSDRRATLPEMLGTVRGFYHQHLCLCQLCPSHDLLRRSRVRIPRRGIVRQIIHEFKYGRQIHLRHLVARWLNCALDDERLRQSHFDVIVPVPLHPTRQRERGFNQAGLLAELLSAQTSIPCKPLLERTRYTTTQTALDRSERMENLHNAFRLRKNANVRSLRVLLVDDVLTTGSTLNECARILKRGGAFSVHAVTAARA